MNRVRSGTTNRPNGAPDALHLLFADAGHRRMLVDREALARPTLAMFRADAARHSGDPDDERLVAHLLRSSPGFAA